MLSALAIPLLCKQVHLFESQRDFLDKSQKWSNAVFEEKKVEIARKTSEL